MAEQQGLHVASSSAFHFFLRCMHAALDPVCSATADFDATHDWAPCTTAKMLAVGLLHLAFFACLHLAKARAPAVHRKSPVQQANEVLGLASSEEPAASSSSVQRSGGGGLVHRR
jgi:hypothetical protein